MVWLKRIGALLANAALAASAPLPAQTSPAVEPPPQHTLPPPLFGQMSDAQATYAADVGLSIERDRDPRALLAAQRRFAQELDAIQSQRPGVVDAYVVAVALDSDPVFAREAREAGRVLSRRYDAAGRMIVLAGPDGRGGERLAMGSPDHLAAKLARVAEVMDPHEDVLVLYTASHGAPWGVVYNDGDQGFGAISPTRLWSMLGSLGIDNRLVLVSACFSGAFVPVLQSPATVIVTASAADRTSFGCQSDNDWTFFGDALINHALRKPQPFAAAAGEATGLIGGWEKQGGIIPSRPQVSIGANTAWLTALERHLPTATPQVGRPSTASLQKAIEHNH